MFTRFPYSVEECEIQQLKVYGIFYILRLALRILVSLGEIFDVWSQLKFTTLEVMGNWFCEFMPYVQFVRNELSSWTEGLLY